MIFFLAAMMFIAFLLLYKIIDVVPKLIKSVKTSVLFIKVDR